MPAQQQQAQMHGENIIKVSVKIINDQTVFHGQTMQISRGQRIHQQHGVKHASMTVLRLPNTKVNGNISQMICTLGVTCSAINGWHFN